MLDHLEATFVLQTSPVSARADRLMDGEDLDSPRVEDARHWLNVYAELAAFQRTMIERATAESSPPHASAGSAPQTVDLARLLADLNHAIERRDHWQGRYLELCGIEADPAAGTVTLGDVSIHVPRRERELLLFLVENPNTTFSAHQLLARAWDEPTLAVEQVRTYISVLRRKLSAAGMGIQIQTSPAPGRGYRAVLVHERTTDPMVSDFDKGFAAGVASAAAPAVGTIPT